jgi:DNA-binding transcriptional ArsR family regulator
MEDVLLALGAPRRREILGLVRRRERSAGDIHRALRAVTFGAVSQHLGVLERAGLVSVRREGRSRLYQARPEGLEPLRAWLETMWDEALLALKTRAEEEERPARSRPRRRGGGREKGRQGR